MRIQSTDSYYILWSKMLTFCNKFHQRVTILPWGRCGTSQIVPGSACASHFQQHRPVCFYIVNGSQCPFQRFLRICRENFSVSGRFRFLCQIQASGTDRHAAYRFMRPVIDHHMNQTAGERFPITGKAPMCISAAPSPSRHHILLSGRASAIPSAIMEAWPIDPTVRKS